MKIQINGKGESLTGLNNKINIIELLKIKNVEMPDMVSVEHNGSILRRENFKSTFLNDGDKIEFLYFMGGGQSPVDHFNIKSF